MRACVTSDNAYVKHNKTSCVRTVRKQWNGNNYNSRTNNNNSNNRNLSIVHRYKVNSENYFPAVRVAYSVALLFLFSFGRPSSRRYDYRDRYAEASARVIAAYRHGRCPFSRVSNAGRRIFHTRYGIFKVDGNAVGRSAIPPKKGISRRRRRRRNGALFAPGPADDRTTDGTVAIAFRYYVSPWGRSHVHGAPYCSGCCRRRRAFLSSSSLLSCAFSRCDMTVWNDGAVVIYSREFPPKHGPP